VTARRAGWALVVAACGGGAAPVVANRAGGAAEGVRAIDWQNRSYAVPVIGEVTVVRGHADFAIGEDGKRAPAGEPGAYDVQPPVFGDVDGDGVDDAVIVDALATGGTGRFSQVRIFTLRGGGPIELGQIPGGDRGDGGIVSVAVEGHAVIVTRAVLAEGDGVCCASTQRRERWAWSGSGLVEDEAARGPLVPTAP
jgi:hypothetical protein